MSIKLYATGLLFLFISHFCIILRNRSFLVRGFSSLGFRVHSVRANLLLLSETFLLNSMLLYDIVLLLHYKFSPHICWILALIGTLCHLNAEQFSKLWIGQDKSICLNLCTYIFHAPYYIYTCMYLLTCLTSIVDLKNFWYK